ncbi:MAG: FG-GAP-like repeat-containing protein [Melioribacteraceae bacterium]|nr:FG-GAP-like repeat-containing protein [Melioribacteraceae bacterium]
MNLLKKYFVSFLFISNFIFAQTWQFDNSPTRQNLARLDMVSDSIGWAISYDGLLLKYESNKWKIVDTLNSISKYNFTTEDSTIINFDNIGDLYAIRVMDDKNGWIAVNNVYQHFYVLSQFDTKNLKYSANHFSVKIRAMDFWHSNIGYAVGEGGGYFLNKKKWVPLKLPISVDFKTVKMVSESKVFICGRNGTLLVGNEKGWQQIDTEINEILRDIDFISENEGWIVGNGGTILHYKDGVINQQIVESVNDLWAVDMVSATSGFAVGKNGTILQYNGNFWDVVEIATKADLHDIELFNSTSGFIVGAQGTILKLTSELTDESSQHTFLFADQVHLGSKYLMDRIDDVYGITIADFNNDLHPDIYITGYKSLNHLLLNNGSGYYKDYVIESGTGGNIETRVGKEKYEFGSIASDFDRDGDVDLLLAGKRNTTRYYKNDGNAKFTNFTLHTNLPKGLNLIDGAVGDLNEDGYPDFVFADETRGLLVFLNDKYNRFYEVNIDSLNLDKTGIRAVKIADINNDNHQDILAVYQNRTPFFLFNNGKVQFTLNENEIIKGEFPSFTNSISFADFNTDGYNDFYICSQDGNDAIFIYNKENKIFENKSSAWNIKKGGRSYTAVAEDFNLDGFVDLFVSRYGQDLLYLNTGKLNFNEVGKDTIYAKAGFLSGFNTGAASSDIDNNGSLDLLVGNSDYWSSILQNSLNKDSFIKIYLTGVEDTKEALGAKIWIWKGGKEHTLQNLLGFKEITPSNGLFSQNSEVTIFGLGNNNRVDVKIRFLNGGTKIIKDVPKGTVLNIVQSSFFLQQSYKISRGFLQVLHMPNMIWKIVKFILFSILTYGSLRYIEYRYRWRPTHILLYIFAIIFLYLFLLIFVPVEGFLYNIFPFGMILFTLIVLMAVNEPIRKANLVQRMRQEKVREAGIKLSRVQIFDEAFRIVKEALQIIYPFELLVFYTYHTNGNVFSLRECDGLPPSDVPAKFTISREKISELQEMESPIKIEECAFLNKEMLKIFEDASLYPLMRKNEILGVVILKLDNETIGKEIQNLELIKYLFLQLSISLDNMRILKDLSEHEKIAAIGAFSSGIIHNLKNPIDGLRMIIEILEQETPKDDPKKEYVEELYRGILSLKSKLLHSFDFVNYSEIRNETLFINELILSIVKKNNLLNHSLFELKLSEDDYRILGDKEQLNFVFENLLQNGIEASNLKNPIIIKSKLVNNKHIKIDVIDFGVGIKDEEIEKIFDMFYSTKGKSRGLGLTLTQKIIKNHNGFINVYSEKNKGTKFSVVLPIV